MSDFNIRKYLAEAEKLSYADFTKGRVTKRGDHAIGAEKSHNSLAPIECPQCDGMGVRTKAMYGPGAEAPCKTCGGKGEIFEGGDQYDDMDFGGGDYERFEPATNMCPSCEGEGCDDCGGSGEIFEGTGLTAAQEVAQDMIDSGFAATSDKNFDDMYDVFMERYREGWGWPDQFREEVRAEYKALLHGPIGAGAKGRGPVTEAESAELFQLLEFAGIPETNKQGKAPGAQVKGNETPAGNDQAPGAGHNQTHKMSGMLVGSEFGDDDFSDDQYDMDGELLPADHEEYGDEEFGMDGDEFNPVDDRLGHNDPDRGGSDPWGLGEDEDWELSQKYQKSPDNPFGTEGNGYDDSRLDHEPTLQQDLDAADFNLDTRDPDEIASKFTFDLGEDLLSEYGDYDDWEDDEDDMYGEPEEDPQGPFITGPYTEQSYWNKTGKFSAESDKLEDLIPAQNEVEDYENNPALENFRIMGNVYYDVHNNGGYDDGYGQRYEELIQISGWDSNGTYSYQDLEDLVDTVTHEAWQEQSAKGVVENFSGAFATGPGIQEDEDDDLIGKGEMDMGSDTMVSPGQIVQVDTSLGGEAKVVAQREGYIVVNLPKGGMKLLRDDEWWIDDTSDGGMDDGYVDVDYDDEEPEELAFEHGEQLELDVDNIENTGAWKMGYKLGASGGKVSYRDNEAMGPDMPIFSKGYAAGKKSLGEDVASVMAAGSQDDRQNNFFSKTNEGYKILPPMDPKYVERDGLEGPFPTRSGKVVYYDPKEGKYYDPDTDIYMSNDEYAEYDRDPDMIYPEFTTPEPKPRERGRMDEFTQEQRLLKHFNTSYGRDNGLRADYDDESKTFSVGQHNDEYGQGAPIWSGNADEFGAKYNVKNRFGIEETSSQLYVRTIDEVPADLVAAIKAHDSSAPDEAIAYWYEYGDAYGWGDDAEDFMDWLEYDEYGNFKEGLEEVWMPRSNDRTGYRSHDDPYKRAFKKRELDHELRGEEGLNNYAIFIDGKHWKTVKNEGHAKAIVKTLVGKGKKAEYKYGAYPMSEGTSTHKKGPKMKGGGYNKPNKPKQKKAASKSGRQADKKAIAAEGSAHDESWLPKNEATTRTYGPNAPLQKPYGGFSRMNMQKLKDFIKKARAEVKNSDDPERTKEVKNWIRNAGSQLAMKKDRSKHRAPSTKYKYTIAKQVGGDDGYQWAVIDKQSGRTIINGLTRPEVKHYRDRAERDLAAKYEASVKHELEPGEEVLDELFNAHLGEIETATDQLNKERGLGQDGLDQERELGEPTTTAGTAADSEAELAGMQQIMKNMLNEPDQDMEDAIQNMAMANTDPNAAQLDTDEVAQLQQLLGLLK